MDLAVGKARYGDDEAAIAQAGNNERALAIVARVGNTGDLTYTEARDVVEAEIVAQILRAIKNHCKDQALSVASQIDDQGQVTSARAQAAVKQALGDSANHGQFPQVELLSRCM